MAINNNWAFMAKLQSALAFSPANFCIFFTGEGRNWRWWHLQHKRSTEFAESRTCRDARLEQRVLWSRNEAASQLGKTGEKKFGQNGKKDVF